jgi:preprotein translocase subunit YajC
MDTTSLHAFLAAAALCQTETPSASPAPAAQPGGVLVPGAGDPAAPSPGPGPAGGPAGGAGGGGGGNFIWIMLLVMLVFIVMTSMAGRKEKRRRAALLAAVKRGDRVQTVGGEIGTIVELTDSEMVLRVDEASNTRIRFARSALQQVLQSRDAKPGAGAAELEPKPRAEATTAR